MQTILLIVCLLIIVQLTHIFDNLKFCVGSGTYLLIYVVPVWIEGIVSLFKQVQVLIVQNFFIYKQRIVVCSSRHMPEKEIKVNKRVNFFVIYRFISCLYSVLFSILFITTEETNISSYS